MQDKDFDQLFRDQLKEAELKPSADLWSKITQEMEPEKKASLPFFWIAASVALMLMVAGVLFTKTEKVRLQGPVPLVQASARQQVASGAEPPVSAEIQPYESTPLVIAPTFDVSYAESMPARRISKKVSAAVQPGEADPRLDDKVSAQAEPVKNESWNQDTRVLASRDTESNVPDAVVNENEQAGKRGLRNVGDLVNFVIEKVDKREEKLLRFSTDDDNSSLIAINIGFIKLNSKKHKQD